MFALRRAAARAVFAQPTRQLSTFQPALRLSIFQVERPALSRSFHQSWKWLADEEQKSTAQRTEASPAEAQTSGETVTTEPSEAELKDIKSESVAASDVVESAKQSAATASKSVQDTAQETLQEAESTASGAAQQAKRFVSSAAETVQNAAYRATGSSREPGGFGRPRNTEPSKILYVGNLFFEVTGPQLEAEFGKIGEVVNSRVVTDSRGLSKGFGYIEFASQDAADRAVHEMDQVVFQGRRMAVQYHIRRESQRNTFATRGGGSVNPPSKTLFVGNMSYQMSDRDLNDLFREIRNVLDVRVAIDRRSGQPRGFAHADFIDVESAQTAKEHLEKKVVYGRQLRVDFSASTKSNKDF